GRGSLFTYGGIKWAVLDHAKGCELCISADIVDKRAFDTENRNDFAVSTLRAWLNGEFLNGLLENGAKKSAFEDLDLDLTSDD
ncbi:MAG: mucin-5AC, partial [Clostridia bacterium]